MNFQRMVELKRNLRELVLADTLDIARIQAEHAEYMALRAEHEAEVAEAEAKRLARIERDRAIAEERRALADKMTTAALRAATGLSGRGWSRDSLISTYISMGIPASG